MCCVSPYVATMEKDPTTKILSEDTMSAEENPPESESVLVKVLSATSQGSGSDTAMMAQLETAAEQYTFTTTPSQEGRTWGKSQELSPQTDVSGRERSGELRVSTSRLVVDPEGSLLRPELIIEKMCVETNREHLKSSCMASCSYNSILVFSSVV